jgi:hypothetical protein
MAPSDAGACVRRVRHGNGTYSRDEVCGEEPTIRCHVPILPEGGELLVLVCRNRSLVFVEVLGEVLDAGPRYTSTSHDREKGFLRAFKEAGVSLDPDHIIATGFHVEAGYAAGQILLAKQDPRTGIFAMTDYSAIGVIGAYREPGQEVGRDYAPGRVPRHVHIRATHYPPDQPALAAERRRDPVSATSAAANGRTRRHVRANRSPLHVRASSSAP